MRWLVLASLAGAARAEPPPEPHPQHDDEGTLARMWRKIREQRVPVVRADGSRAMPVLGATGAALAIGGLVLAVGGAGVLMLWRSGSRPDPDP
jgi:hypothetical protein